MSKVAVKNLLIDEHCPVKGTIVESNGKLYTCALNQTDIKTNANKFYIIQLIKGGSSYTLYTRWGRLSEVGRPCTDTYDSEISGIKAFEKQFKSKTGNNWGTDNFVKKAGKYFMSEVSYDEEIKDLKDVEVKTPPSKLDQKVQELMAMLSDTNMMQDALVSLDIDTKKMPLGKLKDTQIKKAEKILDDIQKLLQDKKNKPDLDTLTELSSEYYTYLPMACGRKIPPVIDNDKLIDKYKEIVDELRNMVVAVQIKNNVKAGENPLDSIYDGIKTEIKPLDKTSQIYEEIVKYVKNTQGSTHNVKLSVVDIYEVEQDGKKKTFEEYCKGIDNRTLLFHGSGMANFLSILKNDLLLNPQAVKKNVVVTGKMFGNVNLFCKLCKQVLGVLSNRVIEGYWMFGISRGCVRKCFKENSG